MSYFEFWKKIWDSKGESDSKDLIFLGGHTLVESEFNIKKVCDGIKESLDIKKTDSILEVGCGVVGRCIVAGCLYSGRMLEIGRASCRERV